MDKLKIITSTVRPSRQGPLIADWIESICRDFGKFEVELLDLAVINLPLMNEFHHPVMQKYEHAHTLNWSAKIDEADAFIFVTAEYDYNYPAPLRNALEYLYKEWNYKPAGIVSYGGLSGGTRASASLMGDLLIFKVVSLMESVPFPFFTKNIDESGEFHANETAIQGASKMLNELHRWSKGMKHIRNDKAD